MGQLTHSIHKSIVYFIKYVVILTVVSLVPVPFLSFFGDQANSPSEYHPIFQYYANQNSELSRILQNTYSNIYISEKQNQAKQSDIDNAFLYADYLNYLLHQEDIPVVRKVIYNQKDKDFTKKYEAIVMQYQKTSEIPQLIQVKATVQDLVPIQLLSNDPKQWIILSLNSDQKIVQAQIKNLSKIYPNDNFLIISEIPIKISKKYYQNSIPKFNSQKARKLLGQSLKVTDEQSKILLNHFQNSLWKIKQSGNDQSIFSLQNLLTENYKDLTQLSKTAKKALQQFCRLGKIKTKDLDLSDYGVLLNNKYYWENSMAKLNYQIQNQQKCLKAANKEPKDK